MAPRRFSHADHLLNDRTLLHGWRHLPVSQEHRGSVWKKNSRIEPHTYTRFFIPCDVLSLILQALGGGMASIASHENRSSATGDHIMVAGLVLQSLTLAIFIVCIFLQLCFELVLNRMQGISIDFAIRTVRHPDELNPKFFGLRASQRFRGCLAAISFATICIFIRSVYRVAELSEGWRGHLIRQQWLFVGLEGVMVAAAVLALNAFTPAFCFGGELRNQTGVNIAWG